MTAAKGPLHTVSKSPFADRALENCVARLTPDSALLLIEDGVYAALAGTSCTHWIALAIETHLVYALAADLAARGLSDKPLVAGVRLVDYDGFVDLAAAHSVVQAWF